jgi:hypothetical protein
MLPANFPAIELFSLVGQACAPNLLSLQNVRSDDPNRWELLSDSNHPLYTLRKNPVIGEYKLAIFTLWRNLAKSRIVIRNHIQKLLIVMNPYSPVLGSISICDFQRFVCTEVVDDYIFPILESLIEDAFNTFREILRPVIYGSNDAYEGLRRTIHILEYSGQ